MALPLLSGVVKRQASGLPPGAEYLIGPAVIQMLDDKVDLVGAVVTVGEDKAVSQGE